MKEYAKLWENQKQLTHSAVNGNKIWLLMISKSFHRMSGRTILLWTPSLKSKQISILFSFRNHLGLPFNPYLALVIAKGNS